MKNKMVKSSKNKLLWDVVMLRDLVVRKTKKLDFPRILQKNIMCPFNFQLGLFLGVSKNHNYSKKQNNSRLSRSVILCDPF
jgi:hypothetical protein